MKTKTTRALERSEAVLAMHRSGKSMTEIGERLGGISRQRVHQIIARVKPMGTVESPMQAAIAINRRLNARLNGNAVVVIADVAGNIYAVREDTDTASLAKAASIIGTYTRRALPDDIAADIEAWRAEFHVERAA